MRCTSSVIIVDPCWHHHVVRACCPNGRLLCQKRTGMLNRYTFFDVLFIFISPSFRVLFSACRRMSSHSGPPHPGDPSTLRDGWKEKWSNSQQQHYWSNKELYKSTWVRPTITSPSPRAADGISVRKAIRRAAPDSRWGVKPARSINMKQTSPAPKE